MKEVVYIEKALIDEALKNFTILVDTREQENDKFTKRVSSFGTPYARHKLDFGDYSAICSLDSFKFFSLEDVCAIERKYGLDELTMCFGIDRQRFIREFERAKERGAKTYLLVENDSWDKAYAGRYETKMSPTALIASMTTWLARYNCQILFCSYLNSGHLIRDILMREMIEYLKAYNYEDDSDELY